MVFLTTQPVDQTQSLLPSLLASPSSRLMMPKVGGTLSFSSNSKSSFNSFKRQELVNSNEESRLLNLIDGYNNNGESWL